MKQLKNFNRYNSAFSAAVGVTASQIATVLIKNILLPEWFLFIFRLVIFAITWGVIHFLVQVGFERLKIIRKIIFGKQFIEGTWIDLMFDGENPISFGISRIDFLGSKIVFGGEYFDLKGYNAGLFSAEMFSVEWPILQYKYSYHHSSNQQLSKEGNGRLQFIPRAGIPKRYKGHYFDLLEGK